MYTFLTSQKGHPDANHENKIITKKKNFRQKICIDKLGC